MTPQKARVLVLESMAMVSERGALLRLDVEGAQHDYMVDFNLHSEADLRRLREQLDAVLADADAEHACFGLMMLHRWLKS